MPIEVEVSKFVITIGKKKIQLSMKEAIALHDTLGERLYGSKSVRRIISEDNDKSKGGK